MPKGTILDRLAGAMKTLGKREGKTLTPRQRVAAAQRWNSLAGIGEEESTRLYDNWMNNKSVYNEPDEYLGRDEFKEFDAGVRKMGLYENADNPFLSDNIDKYREQSDFLDWCRYNRVEPNGRSLKQFRWETYKTLPYRQRQWIANKDAIKYYLGPEMWGYDKKELDKINTLEELDAYLQDRHPEDEWLLPYPMQDSKVFESIEEFPDDFDYMWRY